MNRYFHDFDTSDFYSQTSKNPVLLDFSPIYFSTLDINTTVSTVLQKTHKAPDSYISITVGFGHGDGLIPLDGIVTVQNSLTLNNIAQKAEAYKPKPRTTYKMIKEYIDEKYRFKVHTAYIAEVKRGLGLPMYDAPNAVESLKQPRKHPTPIQVDAIKDALKYFNII